MHKVCFVITSPFVLNAFLLKHLKTLADDHFVTVCVNTAEYPVSTELDPRIELVHVSIARKINLSKDIFALFWLIRFFHHQKFDVVHSVTPKAGLLAMLSAWINRIPNRAHTFTGQVWANRKGFIRFLLKKIDRIIVFCATAIHADSPSQAEFLVNERICKKGEVCVFGSGSINGVDLNKFSTINGRREYIRSKLDIPIDDTVYIFLGRITQEKGVVELAKAFAKLKLVNPKVWLLFVGPDEDELTPELQSICGTNCLFVGLTNTPEAYFDASDVLCLPSYREGFGTVVIEAAAMRIPAIVTEIYGLKDAVINNVTGKCVKVADVETLFQAMINLTEPDVRRKLGTDAQHRVHTEFSAETISNYWRNYYMELLNLRAVE